MSKEYWHTGTLFYENWKYRWSYKYTHCIRCWTCDHKHKWRWLCTSCADKERSKKTNRKKVRKIAKTKYFIKKRIFHWLETPEKKKTWPDKFLTEKDKILYKKSYYQKNKEIIKLISKAYRMEKRGENPMKIIIKWKTRLLPFVWLMEKPSYTEEEKYEEWKKEQEIFLKLKKYYEKK